MVLVKMFYAAQKVYVIDVCRMPIIFHANFPPSRSLRQVAPGSSRSNTTHLAVRYSLAFVGDFSASAEAPRLIMGAISSPGDARNTEIFSQRKRKRNFHGCVRLVGLCPPIPLRRPRSNLMIMRESRPWFIPISLRAKCGHSSFGSVPSPLSWLFPSHWHRYLCRTVKSLRRHEFNLVSRGYALV